MTHYKVLLIDLDGTLLDVEMSFFLGPLVSRMHGFFSDLIGYHLFRKGLFAGTEALMSEPRPEGETNEEGFYRVFSHVTGLGPSESRGRLEDFYTRAYPSLGDFARPVKGGPEFVRAAAERGLVMVLATNPIFPLRANHERLRWAGISPALFGFIPGLENMSSCKPGIRYFLDLAARAGVDPGDCLMIGNDPEQDLPAADVGMGTFLVDGEMADGAALTREPDGRGSLGDLAEMLGIKISPGPKPASSWRIGGQSHPTGPDQGLGS
ncbi:MAG: HAD family hydrolase [Proteobacteria bacterium]|nr:HAD family hydrolase [Pseudomonadota bacterium]